MAVAVQPSPETKKPTQPMGLIAASLIGTAFVLGAAFLVLRAIPWVWDQQVHSAVTSATNSFVSTALLIAIQVAVAVLLLLTAAKLGSGMRVEGVKGGIFFMILVAFVVFFCVKALMNRLGQGFSFSFGNIVVVLFNATILFLVFKFFSTKRFTEWSLAMERGGWFDVNSYKRTQGLRVRRLTMLGILLVAGSGIWTMMNHNVLPRNNDVRLPDGTVASNRMGDWVVGGTRY